MSEVAYDVSKPMDNIEGEAKRQLALFGGLSDEVGRALLANYLGASTNYEMARRRAADAVRVATQFENALRELADAARGATDATQSPALTEALAEADYLLNLPPSNARLPI